MTWVPCSCGEHWCTAHQEHAHLCPCPPIEEQDGDPYAEVQKPEPLDK